VGSKAFCEALLAKVLIADDRGLMRSALKAMFAMRPHWEICGEAADGPATVAKASQLQPDLIILDFKMPFSDGIQAASEICTTMPSVPIIMYTLYKTNELEVAAKMIGIRSVVAKKDGIRSLLSAIDARWALSGWQVGGIFKVSDGIPCSATSGSNGDVLGKNSSGTFDFPNRLSGSGCQTLVNPKNATNYIKTQCFEVPTPVTLRGNAGRNILTGPGLSEFDVSFFKNIHIRRISEVFNIQFRAEIFNLFNRTNLAPPSTPSATDIFDPTGAPSGSVGVLTSTTTTAREIQFAVKIT
jgi:CheY-like chemotaxis protein